jgi:hypothetical protein
MPQERPDDAPRIFASSPAVIFTYKRKTVKQPAISKWN